jgi:hypothetical protein
MLRGGDDVEMRHGVDLLAGKNPGDDRTTKVDADELRGAKVMPWRHDVDAEDPVDFGVGSEQACEPTPEVAGDACD